LGLLWHDLRWPARTVAQLRFLPAVVPLAIEPTILSPSSIDLRKLDDDAVRATQRLDQRGFEAYLVGGCVRDLLLGLRPKDYDIATAARPQQVKRTFPRNCRIIGRRFKLAHLHFHGNTKILEVSTFRRTPQTENQESTQADLLIRHDNEFGTAEEDALRRDFTVNALFLDVGRNCILDYANGLEDLHNRTIRTIGDPRVRFREDPVRILRAAKFAGRLGFHVEPETLAAMAEVAPDLVRAAPPRVLEEILRLLRSGHALDSFQLLRDVGALKHLLPVVATFLQDAAHADRVSFWRILEALDHRIAEGQKVSAPLPQNGVLLGSLMLSPVLARCAQQPHKSPSTVAEELLGPLCVQLRLPRRDTGCVKRICGVAHRFFQFDEPQGFKIGAFATSPYFDEALELFQLRAEATNLDPTLLQQWQVVAQDAHEHRRHGGFPEHGAEGDEDFGGEPAQRAHGEGGEGADEGGPVAQRDGGDGHGEGGRRRRRRRRRRGGRGGDEFDDVPRGQDAQGERIPVEADDGDHGAFTDQDRGEGQEGPFEGEADAAEGGERDTQDANAQQGDQGHQGDQGEGGRRRRRRRRRRGGRGGDDAGEGQPHHAQREGGEGEDQDSGERLQDGAELQDGADTREGSDAPRSQEPRGQRHQGNRQHGRHQQGQRQQGHQNQGQPNQGHPNQGQRQGDRREGPQGDRNDRKGRRDRRRGRRDGAPRDVDVVPRGVDRRGKVDVIEPQQLDLTAFDIELDPKRVPTFGSIVEGKGRPKKRAPRMPDEGRDDYRPPPPPGQGDDPSNAPPPPVDDAPTGGDTFGDW
jgi:poly(A) polymerase